MKIFVGWPADAAWVKDYVIPLIKTYGVTVLEGDEGEEPDFKGELKGAHAALFFLTRRGEPDAAGVYRTSDWVLDAFGHANSVGVKTLIEVREAGVAGGPSEINTGVDHHVLDPTDRLRLLVRLGKLMGGLRGQSLKLKLTPLGSAIDKQFFADDLKRRLRHNNYKCFYRVQERGDVIHGPHEARIYGPDSDNYYVSTDELPASFFKSQDMYLQLDIIMDENQWSCLGISPNVLEVPLENVASLQERPDGGPH